MDLEAVDAALGRAERERLAPGVVGIVGGPDGAEYLGAHGWKDAQAHRPLETDTIFRIASFTKACVAIAVLRLVEQGALGLTTPIGDIIPAFDELQVLEGFDGEQPKLRPPRQRVTLHHLMTHTSGLTYDTFSEDLTTYGAVTGTPMPSTGQKTCFRTPLIFDPGERFAYGMSTDWTGQVVEALVQQPLDVYLQETVFGPLGLQDITFSPSGAQRERVAPVNVRSRDGGFETIDFEYPEHPEFYSGGHGLYATAADFLAIQQLLLNGGALNGVRLLRPETVDMMATDHLCGTKIEPFLSTRREFSHDMDLGPNVTWGLDTMITVIAEPGMRSAGSFGWCGTFNTFYWIDRKKGIAAALYMQYLPFFDPGALALVRDFEKAIYQTSAY